MVGQRCGGLGEERCCVFKAMEQLESKNRCWLGSGVFEARDLPSWSVRHSYKELTLLVAMRSAKWVRGNTFPSPIPTAGLLGPRKVQNASAPIYLSEYTLCLCSLYTLLLLNSNLALGMPTLPKASS